MRPTILLGSKRVSSIYVIAVVGGHKKYFIRVSLFINSLFITIAGKETYNKGLDLKAI